MPRELQRTKPDIEEDTEENHPGGIEESGSRRERVVKEVDDAVPDFIQPGWAVGKRSSSSNFEKVNVFKVEKADTEVLIKFLEPYSFAPIFQHWLLGENGKRIAVTCIVKECPLCARGDRPKSCDYMNVIDMSDPANPELKLWYASPSPAAAIKQRADNKRTSPINRDDLYFVVYKVEGKNSIPEYHLDPVREDELGDWNAKPLTEEQIKAFDEKKYTASVVQVKTKPELTELAKQYLED
jgi:hypothetical protein